MWVLENYSPDEINATIKIVLGYALLVCATSLGVFTRGMIFPAINTAKQNIGYTLLSASISFAIMTIFYSSMTMGIMFVLSIFIGFFLPAFSKLLEGTRLVRALGRAFKKTNSFKDNLIDEIDKELKDDKDRPDPEN